MNKQSERKFVAMLQVTATIAVIGIILLIYTRWQNGPSAVFDLLAYVVSVAALAMTTLQSISISRQIRVTEEAAQQVQAATEKLEQLVSTDKVMTKELKKDIELDEENEVMVRGLYKEENNLEDKLEQLIQELKRIKK